MVRVEFDKAIEQYFKQINPELSMENISETDNLYEKGLIDSLNTVRLIMFLEKLLDAEIRIDKYNIRDFYTIKSLYEKIYLPISQAK
jgi:acyl carrier protein